jgi:hypothetical protein
MNGQLMALSISVIAGACGGSAAAAARHGAESLGIWWQWRIKMAWNGETAKYIAKRK